jgi:hypothetical protein
VAINPPGIQSGAKPAAEQNRKNCHPGRIKPQLRQKHNSGGSSGAEHKMAGDTAPPSRLFLDQTTCLRCCRLDFTAHPAYFLTIKTLFIKPSGKKPGTGFFPFCKMTEKPKRR